jgi:hypothetical protein
MFFLSVSRSIFSFQAVIKGEQLNDVGPDPSRLPGEQRGAYTKLLPAVLQS